MRKYKYENQKTIFNVSWRKQMKFKQIAGMVLLVIFALSVVVPAALADDFDDAIALDIKTQEFYADFEIIMITQVNPVMEDVSGASISGVKTNLENVEEDLEENIEDLEKLPKSMTAIFIAQAELYKNEVSAAIDAVEYIEKMSEWRNASEDLFEDTENKDLEGIKTSRKALENLVPTLFNAREAVIESLEGFGPKSKAVADVFKLILDSINQALLLDSNDSETSFDDVDELMSKSTPFVVADLFLDSGSEGKLQVAWDATNADFVTMEANLNAELCANKDGKLYKLALEQLADNAKDFSDEAEDKVNLVSKYKLNDELEDTFEDFEDDFKDLEKDIRKAAALTEGKDCGTDNPAPAPAEPAKTEWEQYEDLDKAYDEAEEDYEDYDADLEKARDEKDSKDIKKYDKKLDDLKDDTVDDLIKDAEDLLDKVEKDKTIESQKLLINKLEDLIDDLEELEDDIKDAIKGKTNSASNTSSSGSNFIPAKTSTTSSTVKQNSATGNTVQKLSGFPTVGTQQNAVTSTTNKAEFVEIALLVGGLVLVTLVIMFLLAVLLFKK